MKKILIISHGAALGGSPISALNIARHIDKSKFLPIFVFGEEKETSEQAKKEGYKTYTIPRGRFFLVATVRFLLLMLKEKPDIVHLNTLTPYYKYPAIAAKMLGIKIVWFVRENPEEKRCVRLKRYLNFCADKIVTVSLDTAEHLTYAKHEKLTTIYNGIDTKNFIKCPIKKELYDDLGLSLEYGYITVIASFEERKGVLDAINGFALLGEEAKDYKLLLVGEDRTQKKEYLTKMERLIIELGLQDRVILYGATKRIRELLSVSAIFLLPSYWEGMARVILEAMSIGVPIVATNIGGNKEQVVDGVNGYLYEPKNIEQMAEKLRLILDKTRQESFGKASREIALQKFDIKETTRKIEELYCSISS